MSNTGITMIIVAMFATIAIISINEHVSNDNMAKSGLEQCPVEDSSRVIWVKDCIKFMEAEREK